MMSSPGQILVLLCLLALALAEEKEERTLSPESQQRLLEEMVWVEGGTFTMGSDLESASRLERPAHEVTLRGFYIGKFEVSQDG